MKTKPKTTILKSLLLTSALASINVHAVEPLQNQEAIRESVDRRPAIIEKVGTEVLVDIQGLTDYEQYNRIKTKIEEQLPEGSHVRVKQLARGKAVLSLETVVAANDISQVLVNLPLEPGYFLLKGIKDNRIRVEIQ